jgi:hypothetical protein
MVSARVAKIEALNERGFIAPPKPGAAKPARMLAIHKNCICEQIGTNKNFLFSTQDSSEVGPRLSVFLSLIRNPNLRQTIPQRVP